MSLYGEFLDPYQCVAVLRCPQPRAAGLRASISGLLEGLDPTLQIISLVEETSLDLDGGEPGQDALEKYEPFSEQDKMRVPSLAVCLFLSERGSLSADTTKKRFTEPPWKFHHSIELSSAIDNGKNRSRCFAKQEFYEIDKEKIYPNATEYPWPIWSISPVHYGNEHLRFTIFTNRYKEMLQFYRSLTGREAEFTRDTFCYFEVYSQPGLDIQLALKSSPSLDPQPAQSCNLCIRTKSLQAIICFLDSDPVQLSLSRWMVTDPDGNHLVVEEVRECPVVLPHTVSYFKDSPPGECHSSQRKSKARRKALAWMGSNDYHNHEGPWRGWAMSTSRAGDEDASSCCSFCKQVESCEQGGSTGAARTSSFDSGFSGRSAWSLSTREEDSDTFTLADSDWDSDSTLTGVSSLHLYSATTHM